MRVKQTFNVRVATDTNMDHIIFGKDDNLAVVTHDEYDQQTSGTINIPMDTNENLPLGDIDNVKGFLISVDQDCTLKLNGGSEEINVVKPTGGNAYFGMNGSVTAINIASPVNADLTGLYCVWGD